MLDLGLREHPEVKKALQVLYNGQNYDGGWICQRGGPCVDESNCIISGSPWSFSCLVEANIIKLDDPIAKNAILMFTTFKKEIMKHGYMTDRCYRCDESILIPYLYSLGLSNQDSFFRKLYNSLKNKQYPDGSWYFRGNRSSWYTIEAAYVLSEFGEN